MKKINLSVIVPILNEDDNLLLIYKKLKDELPRAVKSHEIIFIDDGSTDRSLEILKGLKKKDKFIKVYSFIKNFGQTAAIMAGVEKSKGEIIVTIDADLQNDPKEIKKLVGYINKGYDVASGWRKDRHMESYFSRKIPSVLANKLISWIVGLKLHDYGCTFKAYRKEIIKNISLYGEMHRFIPAYAFWRGAKIVEVQVSYKPRRFGSSKYNISRTYKVLLDLMTLKFLESFITKPIYVFGSIGFLSFIGGGASGTLLIFNKLARGISMINSPLLLLTALFIILGAMFIAIGLLSEIIVRTYYESQNKKTYILREIK